MAVIIILQCLGSASGYEHLYQALTKGRRRLFFKQVTVTYETLTNVIKCFDDFFIREDLKAEGIVPGNEWRDSTSW